MIFEGELFKVVTNAMVNSMFVLHGKYFNNMIIQYDTIN